MQHTQEQLKTTGTNQSQTLQQSWEHTNEDLQKWQSKLLFLGHNVCKLQVSVHNVYSIPITFCANCKCLLHPQFLLQLAIINVCTIIVYFGVAAQLLRTVLQANDLHVAKYK